MRKEEEEEEEEEANCTKDGKLWRPGAMISAATQVDGDKKE